MNTYRIRLFLRGKEIYRADVQASDTYAARELLWTDSAPQLKPCCYSSLCVTRVELA